MKKEPFDKDRIEIYGLTRLMELFSHLPKEVSCLVVDDDVFESLKRMTSICEECHGDRDYIPLSGYRILKRSRIVDVYSNPAGSP